MEIIVFSLFWALVGMFFGGYMVRRNTIDYKERWQQAVKLLEDGPEPREKIVLVKPPDGLPAKTKQRPKEAEMSLQKLHQMSNSARVTIELNRLKAGLPPRDDLWNMSNNAIVQIETERTKRGWS